MCVGRAGGVRAADDRLTNAHPPSCSPPHAHAHAGTKIDARERTSPQETLPHVRPGFRVTRPRPGTTCTMLHPQPQRTPRAAETRSGGGGKPSSRTAHATAPQRSHTVSRRAAQGTGRARKNSGRRRAHRTAPPPPSKPHSTQHARHRRVKRK